jgi:hypothetical protein
MTGRKTETDVEDASYLEGQFPSHTAIRLFRTFVIIANVQIRTRRTDLQAGLVGGTSLASLGVGSS